MPKKKFIDKKNSVSFRLVHRSQRDPLIATDAGEHVLTPIDTEKKKKEKSLEEEHKYGIFYDDEYDYLQHLRDVNEVYSLEGEPLEERFRVTARMGMTVPSGQGLALTQLSINDQEKDDEVPGTSEENKSKLNLPSSVLGSSGVELRTGLLNQAAPVPGPHPELDPDILEALDDDFDFDNPENQILDDFVVTANARRPEGGDGSEAELSSDDDDASSTGNMGVEDGVEEEEEEMRKGIVHKLDEQFVKHEETRSRFTAYSMTSSVIRRSEGLQTVDDMFEKVYEEYDDDEMGDLAVDAHSQDFVVGFIEPDSERMESMLREYQEQLAEKRDRVANALGDKDSEVLERARREEQEGEEPMERILVDEDRKREKWDCESILSTYSTLYNHPTLITEPPGLEKKRKRKMVEIQAKSGLPLGVLEMKKGGAKVLSGLPGEEEPMEAETGGESRRSLGSTYRPKGETPEERRRRKRVVKEERKERRIEKKANKMAFKEEEARQTVETLNRNKNSGVLLM